MTYGRLLVGFALAWASGSRGGWEEQPGEYRPVADRHGIVSLDASRATLDGERLRLSTGQPPVIVEWVSSLERVVWTFEMARQGRYVVVVEYAAASGRGGAEFEVEIAGQVRRARVHATGAADRFLPQPLKEPVELESGHQKLVVRALEAPRGHVMDLARVRLIPAEPGPDPR